MAYTRIKEGDKKGLLTVLCKSGRNAQGILLWKCICACGQVCEKQAAHLNKFKSPSCGCYSRYSQGSGGRTHGMSKTPEWAAWKDAKARCHNPKNKAYKDYGGRGIEMCKEWRDSFQSFLASMGKRPDGMTLERVDVNRGYEPSNCIWATQSVQASNRRNGIKVEIKGRTMPMAVAAKILGISTGAAYQRWRRGTL